LFDENFDPEDFDWGLKAKSKVRISYALKLLKKGRWETADSFCIVK
jgi:hypothetical protein